ncbi:MAG: metallophosphoesterase [Clostridia bacterium]|nr:metallophosphoesterase [Clostridia bacterium]
MRKMRTILASLMCISMLLTLLGGLTLVSADDTPSVTTDKTVYLEGEDIMVTGTGSAAAKDWIGIQPKDDTGNSIYWYYITDATNGVPVNITKANDTVKTSSRPNPNDYNLPAGDYIVYFVPSNGYAASKTLTVEITITAKLAAAPTAFTYELTDATSGWAAGSASVTAATPWVVLYWGDANGKLADQAPLGYWKTKNGVADITVEAGIPVPVKATRVLAYGCETDNESATCMAVDLPAGSQAPLSTNKMTYVVGEPILVTAHTDTPTALDWVGFAAKGSTASFSYYYLYENYNNMTTNDVAVDATLKELPMVVNGNREWTEFIEGTYDVAWIAKNDYYYKNSFLFSFEVVATAPDPFMDVPAAPVSATYTLENETDGMADGSLEIQLAEGHTATDIVMYWANAEGKLTGYTALAKFKVASDVTEITHPMVANTLIPAGATKLLIYTSNQMGLSETPLEVTLPEGAAGFDFGAVIDEFQVVSDIHITADNTHTYNQNFLKMLQDVAQNSPNSSGIYVNGDMANSGSATEYENMWSLYESVEGLPAMYLGLGNHDLYGGYETGVELFCSNVTLEDGSHPETPYYDVWKNGYHFIFLASDTEMSSGTMINEEQMTWFRSKLDENREVDKPVFVFLHTPMYETVSGSAAEEGWYGVNGVTEASIRKVLKDYPEVVFFTGHTHWTLDGANAMRERSANLPTLFNTAAVAYLWSGYDVVTGENLDGSQGYYVRVYEDKLLVLGRDFTTGEWVSSAQFVVDFASLTPAPEPMPDPDPNPDPTPTPDDGDTTTEPIGDTTTEPVNGGNDDGSKGANPLPIIIGCVVGVIALAAVVVVIVVIKKKH